MPPGTWEEYEKLVLKEIKYLNKRIENVDKHLIKLIEDVSSLKVKAGIWGGIAGLIPAAIVLIYFIVKHLI